MSLIGVSRADKVIIAHLSHGGDINDSLSDSLVSGLIRESLEDKKIAAAVAFHSLSPLELSQVYKECFMALLPNPLIHHGDMLLVCSLPFMDDINFPGMLDLWCAHRATTNDPDERMQKLLSVAIISVLSMRDQAAAQGRLLDFPVSNMPTVTQILERQQMLKMQQFQKMQQMQRKSGCLGFLMFK